MAFKTNLQTKLLLTSMLLLTAFFVNAQKLPNVQTTSLRIPATIRIDGKTTEWNNNFQAYNNATSIYYTMANNAEFVYLIAHIKDPAVIERMTYNGFTFEIYKNENSRNKDIVSVTLPYSGNKYFTLNFSKPTGADTTLEKNMLKSNNALLSKHHKFMVVKGIQGLDSVSVYNDAGIGFAEAFDNNEDYTVELQLPIQFIKLLPGDNSKFAYRLLINGLPDRGPIRGMVTLSPNGSTTFTNNIPPEHQAGFDELKARIAKKNAPTDFKAEYTLVKE